MKIPQHMHTPLVPKLQLGNALVPEAPASCNSVSRHHLSPNSHKAKQSFEDNRVPKLELGNEGKQPATTILCIVLLTIALIPARAQAPVDRIDMKAHAAFEAQDYKSAILLWSEVIKLEPNDASARFNRGFAYANDGQTEKAIADYSEAIRLDPSDAETHAKRALSYVVKLRLADAAGKIDTDDTAGVVADYMEMIRLDPDRGYEYLAGFNRKFYKQSLDYWSTALKADPKSALAWAGRADACAGAKDAAGAVAGYGEAIRLDPSNRHFLEARSAFYKAQGDKAKAAADHEEAVRLLFAGHEPVSEQWAREQAALASDSRDSALAVAAWSAIIKIRPNDPDAWTQRGSNDYAIDPDKAIADYTEAIRVDPKYSRAYASRGDVYINRGDNAKAEADMAEVIKLDPGNYLAYVHRADYFNNHKEWDKVAADCDEALRLNPGSEDALILRGDALKALGRYDKAIENALAYIAAVPDSPQGYDMAAWIYAACPDPKYRDGAKALELAQKSCELAKWDFCEAVAAIAAAEADCGKWDDAVKHVKQAINMVKGDNSLLERSGEYADQLAHYEKKQTYSEKEGAPR